MAEMTLDAAISARRSCRSFNDQAISLEVLQRLLWAGQGITDESGKRTVPSAHALHPLKLLVISGNVSGLQAGLYEANPQTQDLTLLRSGDLRPALETAALEDQPWVGKASAIIAVCADFETPRQAFADQPPVAQRGCRYVFIEAGGVAQNIQLQAAAEGLDGVLVAGFDDDQVSQVLQLTVPIEAVLLICLGWPAAD